MVPVRIGFRHDDRQQGFSAHNRRREGVKGGKPSPLDTLDHDVPILDVIHEPTGLAARRSSSATLPATTRDDRSGKITATAPTGPASRKSVFRRRIPQAQPPSSSPAAAQTKIPEPRQQNRWSFPRNTERNWPSPSSRMMARDEGVEITGPDPRGLRRTCCCRWKSQSRAKSERAKLASDDPLQPREGKIPARSNRSRMSRLITEYPAATQAIRLGDATDR